MRKSIFSGILLLAAAYLLSACAVPEWVIDAGGDSSPLSPQSSRALATVAATGTPIDAMIGSLRLTNSELQVVEYPTQTAVAKGITHPQEASGDQCSDAETGNSLGYTRALAIAADSECTTTGDLLPAHFCHQESGTWWISLSVQKDGCNPACVVDVNSHSAAINWRCTGALIPAEDTPQPQLPALEINPTEEDFAAYNEWQGVIQRQPYGSLVAYRFLRDDGQWFDIGSPENDIRLQFAGAAWSGARVALSGEESAVPGTLNVLEMVEQQTAAAEARNLTAFAMPSSSSQLASDEGGSYHAWSAVDGLLRQPWCEGADGPGSGEWLQLDFTAPLEITEIKMANGYQSGDFLFVLNNRIQTAAIVVDDERIVEWELPDTRDWQTYTMAGDAAAGVVTSSVRLVIEETIDGWEFDDSCIAEVEVWGKPVE